MESSVRVLSTLALAGAVRALAEKFELKSGARIDADFAPTVRVLERLKEGETADVLILTDEGLAGLIAAGSVGAESRVGRSCAVGLAGASHGAASATMTRSRVNTRPQRPVPLCFRKSCKALIRGVPADLRGRKSDRSSYLRIHRRQRSRGYNPATADNRAPGLLARRGGRLRARKKWIQ